MASQIYQRYPLQNFTAYLFVFFTGNETEETDEQIYFAISHDGLSWKDLRTRGDPILTWSQGEGGVRDPYIVRGPDRVFHIIATNLSVFHRGGWQEGMATINGSTGLVVWDSTDLVHWTQPRILNVAANIPGAGMAWAPEACWDAQANQWIIFWATRARQVGSQNKSSLANELGSDTNMYYATSPDLNSLSQPVKWIDRRNGVIDTTMLLAPDGWWYRASKDGDITLERTKNPYAASYEVERTDNDQAWSYLTTVKEIFGQGRYSSGYLEGPELFMFNTRDISDPNGRSMPFGLICDQFAENKGYLLFRSSDLSSTKEKQWSLVDYANFGETTKRHGSILPITDKELDLLENTWSGD